MEPRKTAISLRDSGSRAGVKGSGNRASYTGNARYAAAPAGKDGGGPQKTPAARRLCQSDLRCTTICSTEPRRTRGMRSLGVLLIAACMLGTCLAQSSGKRAEAEYYVRAYARHYHVPEALVRAVVERESNWQICAVSSKGEIGRASCR